MRSAVEVLRVLEVEDAAFVLEGIAEAVVFVEDALTEDERTADDLVGAAATVATAVVEKILLVDAELVTSSESSHS